MVTFGLVSSVFDYLTFGTLLLVLRATTAQFRTGWFLESVVTELLIMMVIRTRQLFWRSRPAKYLLMGTVAVGITTLVLPYTPVGAPLGLVPIPLPVVFVLGGIAVGYAVSSEVAKHLFYRRAQG